MAAEGNLPAGQETPTATEAARSHHQGLLRATESTGQARINVSTNHVWIKEQPANQPMQSMTLPLCRDLPKTWLVSWLVYF